MFNPSISKATTMTLSLGLPLLVVGLLLLGLPALTEARELDPPPPAPAVDALSPLLQSTVGATFTYQGRLLQGTDAVSGTCNLTFALFDSLSGGSQVGSDVTNSSIAVQDGYFTQDLNFGDTAFDGDARWLEITINSCNGGGSSATLSPRVAVTAAPYAMHADQVPWSGVNSVPGAYTDVNGTYPNLTVVGLQMQPVSTTMPTTGQVLQWDGSAWTPGSVSAGTIYSVGDGLLLNGSTFSANFAGTGALTTVARSDHNHNDAYWSLSGNSGTGSDDFVGTTDSTTLTLKVNNQTGLRLTPGGAGAGTPNVIGGSADNVIASGIVGGVIGGGESNEASGNYATVSGGDSNKASDNRATVGGGYNNEAGSASVTVSGGQGNKATADYTTIAGGRNNVITGTAGSAGIGGGRGNVITGTANYANISGGYHNEVSGLAATVGGGWANDATADYATVGGGEGNTAITGTHTTVGGGSSNEASANYATVGGGNSNETSAESATVGGGEGNKAITGTHTTVGGGYQNEASGNSATVGGGRANDATGNSATVGGGRGNDATANYATVGGGWANDATADLATVGGGRDNIASGDSATVGGGHDNNATANYATVGGGEGNIAIMGTHTTVGGGWLNQATANYATVGGGRGNDATANSATVGGGHDNNATANYATVPGGRAAQASHYGEMAYAAGWFELGEWGDAQTSVYVLRNITNSSAPTATLYLDGASELLTIADDRVVTFDILVVAAQTNGGCSAGRHYSGVIENIGGTTSLFVTSLMVYEWPLDVDVAVEADDTNNALVINVTGPYNEVRWVATVRTVEVGF